jgi:hypothetical protein
MTRRDLVRRGAATGIGLALGPALADTALGALDAEIRGVHRFVSRPDLRPPVLEILHRKPGTAQGHLLLAPLSGPGQRGALIMDDRGDPLWFRGSQPVVALNLRAGFYRGRPVLSWWEGKTEHGLGEGTHIVVDRSYREVARIPAGGGRATDLHEFVLTDRGTALVTAWESIPMNLTGIGGLANGTVVGGIVQELELPSGRVLFEWRSIDHVPIGESYTGITTRAAYDYFHVNSVALDRDGNYLVSARNTWTIYKIHRGSGEVMWRLGGKRSDFHMGPGTRFAWQHDARRHGVGGEYHLSLFDDGAAPAVQPQSKAMILALDVNRMRATLHRKYTHRPSVLAHALGSTQVLPNGNVLVGWGTAPYLTEYGKHGEVLLDAKLPRGGQNYRVLRMPWVGHPTEKPALAARRTAGRRLLYASWNGATEVASWRIDSGSSRAALAHAGTYPRTAFETRIVAEGDVRYARATAVDAKGKPLGVSPIVRV